MYIFKSMADKLKATRKDRRSKEKWATISGVTAEIKVQFK